MSGKVRIKIHNVHHEEAEYDLKRAQRYIKRYPSVGYDIDNVRIATGQKNSPLYLTVNTRSLAIDEVKEIAYDAVSAFTQFVDGINVEKTIRDNNIRVMTE